jgi:hypothetical protein
VTRRNIITQTQAVRVAEQRLDATEAFVAEERDLPPEERAIAPAPPTPLETRLDELRAQLAFALANRTPEHPEVRELRNRIAQLEAITLGTGASPAAGGERESAAPRVPALMRRQLVDANWRSGGRTSTTLAAIERGIAGAVARPA